MMAKSTELASTIALANGQPMYLSSVRVIEDYSDAELTELVTELNQTNQPILLKGLADKWPLVIAAKTGIDALQSYLMQYQLQPTNDLMVGTGSVPVSCNGRLFYNEEFTGFNFSRQSQSFSTFLSEIFDTATGENPTTPLASPKKPQRYLGSTQIDKLFPGMRTSSNDITALALYSPLINMWMSNRTQVAAHQDLPHNLAVCVAGKRRFTLFPPEQVSNLYIGPLDLTPAGQAISLVNHQSPDFDAHPKYQEALAHAQVAALDAGDALLLPSLWWHSVESLEPLNILVNYWWQPSDANHATKTNHSTKTTHATKANQASQAEQVSQSSQSQAARVSGAPNDALLHALMTISHLPANQKDAIKALFDYYIFNEQTPKEQFAHIPEGARGVLNSNDELAIRKLRAMLLNKLNQ